MAPEQGTPPAQISTHGKLQNSCQLPLHHFVDHVWEGHVDPAHSYPNSIENGVSREFVHYGEAESNQGTGSVAAVVYQGGQNIRWLMAWSNHPTQATKKVYTEIFEPQTLPSWEMIKTRLENSHENPATSTFNGYSAVVTIDEGTATPTNLVATIDKVPV